MNATKLSLSIMPDILLAICRLEKENPIPAWAMNSPFFSITKTDDELSVVCNEKNVPDSIKSEKGRKAFKVIWPLDLSLTGITASLTTPLAEAKINIFAISTFDTDYILIKENNIEKAKEVLRTFCTIL